MKNWYNYSWTISRRNRRKRSKNASFNLNNEGQIGNWLLDVDFSIAHVTQIMDFFSFKVCVFCQQMGRTAQVIISWTKTIEINGSTVVRVFIQKRKRKRDKHSNECVETFIRNMHNETQIKTVIRLAYLYFNPFVWLNWFFCFSLEIFRYRSTSVEWGARCLLAELG